jgi:hypothetical protein
MCGARQGNQERSGERTAERAALDDFLSDIRRVRLAIDPSSDWHPTLEVLEEEVRDGQPLFFKFARTSSSRSRSETPAVS